MLVIGALARGGAERVASVLTAEWERTHDVTLVVFDGRTRSYTHGGELVDLRLPSRPTRFANLVRLFSRILRLASLLYRARPTRIVAFMENANLPVVVAATICGMASRTHVSVRNNPSSIKRGYRLIIPWLYRIPRCVVVPSVGIRCALIRRGMPSKGIVAIPNPVPRVVPGEVLEPFRRPRRYILGVGRLVPQKRFELLIEAYSKLDVPDVNLVILGDGPERIDLESKAFALGVGPQVEFRGTVDRIDFWYRNAVCFVLTSRYEGWPNVLVEAMANGCPVISVDCPYGPSEILENGTYGMLVRRADVDGLSEAMRSLLMDPGLRATLGFQGARRVKCFEPPGVASLWLS